MNNFLTLVINSVLLCEMEDRFVPFKILHYYCLMSLTIAKKLSILEVCGFCKFKKKSVPRKYLNY